MLAAWMNPMLLGGLGLVAAPIIIHLLNRRRFKRVRWAATDWLLEANRRNRRRVQIEQLILLALRCLAVILLALLLARPFVQPGTLAALLGAAARSERVVVLDDSFSMGYRLGRETTFDIAKARVKELLAWVQQERPRDPVTLLLTSRPDQPLINGVELGAADVSRMQQQIDALAVSEQPAQMDRALLAAADSLGSEGRQPNAAVCVISDFQRGDWVKSDAGNRVSQPARALAEAVGEDGTLSLVLLDVGRRDMQNLAITDLRLAQRQAAAGVEARLEIDVANFGTAPVEGVELQVTVGDQAIPVVPLKEIGAGQTQTVPLDVTFWQAGSQSVTARLSTDALAVDDRRSLAVEVVSAVKVLIVNGEPNYDAMLDEVAVLRAALRPAGPAPSGNDVRVIDEGELEQTDPGPFDVTILANVYRVGAEIREALERYVADGGGLVMFLGDQVDPELYNRELWQEGAGILPVRLGDPVRVTGGRPGVKMAAGSFDHPIVRVFAGDANPFVGQLYVWGYVAAQEAQPGTRPTTTAAAGDLAGPTRVVARLADPMRTPLILERSFGRGRVVLVTTSADGEWNNWPGDPSYIVTMLETVKYVCRSPVAGQRVGLVGAPLEVVLSADEYVPQAVLEPPGFPVRPAEPIIGQPDPARGGLVLRKPAPQTSGVWALTLTQTDGEPVRVLAAVNVDPGESDVATVSKQELATAMPEIDFEYLRDTSAFSRTQAQARQELWPWLLICATVVLCGEQLLAWWFGRRG